MVTEKVKCLNKRTVEEEDARTCMNFLRDLSSSRLELLRGILLKASLESLVDYFINGYLDNVQRISVSVEKIEKVINAKYLNIPSEYMFGKEEEEYGNMAFFFPIGLILESVLPNNLEVIDDRDFYHDGDDIYILSLR